MKIKVFFLKIFFPLWDKNQLTCILFVQLWILFETNWVVKDNLINSHRQTNKEFLSSPGAGRGGGGPDERGGFPLGTLPGLPRVQVQVPVRYFDYTGRAAQGCTGGEVGLFCFLLMLLYYIAATRLTNNDG